MNDCKISVDGKTYCPRCATFLGIQAVEIPEWVEPGRVSAFADKKALLDSIEEGAIFECFPVGHHSKSRAQKETNTVFVFGHRKRMYGHRYSESDFLSKFDMKSPSAKPSAEDEWLKRISKAISCIEKSGLWPEMLPKLKNLKTMELKDKRDIYRIYFDMALNPAVKTQLLPYAQKYPFAFTTDDEGNVVPDVFYIYELSDVRLKTMYFGKGRNQSVKSLFKNSMTEKRDYSVKVRAIYDVTLDYKASDNRAWYSEEYRDCGNGHYYIALNENTAWFCEDD